VSPGRKCSSSRKGLREDDSDRFVEDHPTAHEYHGCMVFLFGNWHYPFPMTGFSAMEVLHVDRSAECVGTAIVPERFRIQSCQ
jgi:hypothetical protein